MTLAVYFLCPTPKTERNLEITAQLKKAEISQQFPGICKPHFLRPKQYDFAIFCVHPGTYFLYSLRQKCYCHAM